MRVSSFVAVTAMASAMFLGTSFVSFADENGQNGGQQTPGQQQPGQQHPGEQNPGQQHPGQQHPGQQNPGQQLPGHPDQEYPGHQCGRHQRDGMNCNPATKEACFNVACYYVDESRNDDFRSCKVVTRFNKRVTIDGGEVADSSRFPNNPELAVICNEKLLYNGPAYRFTGLLETRIQGEMGPHPAILLPRGALNAGFENNGGEHVVSSILEIDAKGALARIHGSCQIWTGAPLL